MTQGQTNEFRGVLHCASRTVCVSLDRGGHCVKVLLHEYDQIMRQIQSEGFRGLWQGVGCRMMYLAPNYGMHFAIYETCLSMLQRVQAE